MAARSLSFSLFSLRRQVCEIPPPPRADHSKLAARLARSRPGEIAPGAIIRCVDAACTEPSFAAGVAVEKREFATLVRSPESAALRHMFFAERAGSKVDGVKVKPARIDSVGIIGAGLMGGA